ncbi:MAG: DNA mismatch repair protein MutS [Candidatus Thermoplasmatota archaeon]|nr:DNA mismatch repair protein MutS [Candidatus Thermoplasmatota archaeon]
MMEQYYEIKNEYPDSIVFFRMGDFYEMFDDDAELVSDELDITLTSRDKDGDDPTPMAGVPYHSVESYLQSLINKGYTVAIAEQTQDPDEASGIVDREVVRVVTPGTVVDDGMIESSENNFLICIYGKREPSKSDDGYGISAVDVSTGDFFVTEVDEKGDLLSEILRYEPTECLLPNSLYNDEEFLKELKHENEMMVHTHREDAFHTAKSQILDHFNANSLEPFGLKGKNKAVKAAGATLDYLKDTQKRTMNYIKRLRFYSPDKYMTLDATTLKNLEIFRSLRDRSKEGTLLSVLDETVTAMGSRKLRNWLQQPLLDLDSIKSRLDAVEILTDSIFLRDDLREKMDGLYDLERLISRVVYGNADARDLLAIQDALSRIPSIRKMLIEKEFEDKEQNKLGEISERIDPLEEIREKIGSSIVDDPPATVKEGGIIKDSFDEELDELKRKSKEGKEWINSLEEEERENTGINNLKVGYNKVHGYYLEVPKSKTDKVPEHYSRKQTLKNAERYYTEKLKDKEEEIISAEEKMEALEYEIFKKVREDVGAEAERFQETAGALAELDVLTTFAHVAIRNNYNRPEIFPGGKIEIREGRHPVVEKTIDENFVPNDAELDDINNQFLIITGPNMSGKSTYMRQIALITLMAQVGCFVPAEEAKIGMVDRIFTRVGALDDLTKGQSTFMVEMVELANILHSASENSLILLDEIGSGTSTFDGLSIAWAVTEYICREIEAKTLFATHYHEITELEKSLDKVKNLHVVAKDTGGEIKFLRKVREGSTDESYGIHVASLAGLPDPVVDRSNEVLNQIEEDHTIKMKKHDGPRFTQMVFDPESDEGPSSDSHPVVEKLKEMKVDNMTPMDAINELWKLKNDAEED